MRAAKGTGTATRNRKGRSRIERLQRASALARYSKPLSRGPYEALFYAYHTRQIRRTVAGPWSDVLAAIEECYGPRTPVRRTWDGYDILDPFSEQVVVHVVRGRLLRQQPRAV